MKVAFLACYKSLFLYENHVPGFFFLLVLFLKLQMGVNSAIQ